MSLLMEALRKAELEKKKAAQRLEQTVEHAQLREKTGGGVAGARRPTGEITTEHPITRLDPTVVRSKEELLAATAQLSLAPIEAHPAPESVTARPDAPVIDASEDLTINVLMDQTAPDLAEVTAVHEVAPPATPAADKVALEVEPEVGADTPLDESFHDAMLDAGRELPGIYDETIQGEPFRAAEPERSYDETLPGVSAAELARDLGEENQPTPVAAQTIFTATATTRPALSFKWPLIIGLGIVAAVMLGVIIYQTRTPEIRMPPSPEQVAGEMELIRPPIVADTLVPAPVTEPVTTAVESGPAGTAQDQPPAAGAVTAVPTESESPSAEIASETVNEAAAAAADSGQPPAYVEISGRFPPGEAPTAAAAPLAVEPALIKISRSKAPDDRGRLLNEAYRNYLSGDFAGASQMYKQVVESFPDNRDALLGLGAIAMRQGDAGRAREIYLRLFRLNPRDPFARAALISLDVKTDTTSRLSALKVMADEDPENALLHFALGNLYAAQSRWAEAQEAFFDAFRIESTNADYALNLAISLDHLGQAESALDYYNTALKLADERAAQFDSAKILARIQTLTADDR
jgi:Flp pilus assembly protein TadD